MPADTTVVLTIPEVAERLRIGRNQAYELVRSGQLYGVRIGRSIRVPQKALDDLLAAPDRDQ
jgi:excisionase family DNA binding protein